MSEAVSSGEGLLRLASAGAGRATCPALWEWVHRVGFAVEWPCVGVRDGCAVCLCRVTCGAFKSACGTRHRRGRVCRVCVCGGGESALRGPPCHAIRH